MSPWTEREATGGDPEQIGEDQHTVTRSKRGIWYHTLDRHRCRVGIRQGHLLLINYSRLMAEHVTSRAELE